MQTNRGSRFKKILVVYDDRIIRDIIMYVLKSEDYQVSGLDLIRVCNPIKFKPNRECRGYLKITDHLLISFTYTTVLSSSSFLWREIGSCLPSI